MVNSTPISKSADLRKASKSRVGALNGIDVLLHQTPKLAISSRAISHCVWLCHALVDCAPDGTNHFWCGRLCACRQPAGGCASSAAPTWIVAVFDPFVATALLSFCLPRRDVALGGSLLAILTGIVSFNCLEKLVRAYLNRVWVRQQVQWIDFDKREAMVKPASK